MKAAPIWAASLNEVDTVDLKIHIGIHTSKLYTRHGMYLSNWKRILHKRIANRHYTTYPSRNGLSKLRKYNGVVFDALDLKKLAIIAQQ